MKLIDVLVSLILRLLVLLAAASWLVAGFLLFTIFLDTYIPLGANMVGVYKFIYSLIPLFLFCSGLCIWVYFTLKVYSIASAFRLSGYFQKRTRGPHSPVLDGCGPGQ